MRGFWGLNWVELTGYAASLLVFLAFYMKTMIPLRIVGIANNLAFIAYASGAGLYPILILHVILLPLNCLRFTQMRTLINRVRESSQADLSMEGLVPFMRRRTWTKGEILFQKGDSAREMYLILSGSIRMLELGVTVGPGSVLGEIGIFAPTGQRMDTAICETEAELGVIDNDKVLQLYHQNPKFGFYLIKLVSQRLLNDYAKLLEASRATKGLAAPRESGSPTG